MPQAPGLRKNFGQKMSSLCPMCFRNFNLTIQSKRDPRPYIKKQRDLISKSLRQKSPPPSPNKINSKIIKTRHLNAPANRICLQSTNIKTLRRPQLVLYPYSLPLEKGRPGLCIKTIASSNLQILFRYNVTVFNGSIKKFNHLQQLFY